MDPRYRRALLFAVFGVALLANPLYLYPDGVSSETTYTYEATETDRIPEADALRVDVRECHFASRECDVARGMAQGTPVEVPAEEGDGGDIRDDAYWGYDYVELSDGYYEPNMTVENGTLVLSLDAVSTETVRQAAATDVEDTRPFVQWAMENGTVNVTDERVPYEARRFYVERGETYFLVEPTASERRATGWGWKTPSDVAVDAMRLGAWLAAIAFLWRAGEWSERGRRAQKRRDQEQTREERLR